MALKSHTAEEIRERLASDPTLKIFEVDSGLAGEDDILLGEDYTEVSNDLAVFHGWDNDPEYWVHTDHGWETADGTWVMDSETYLPVGWRLREIPRSELSAHGI
jgi:hypothetical protein